MHQTQTQTIVVVELSCRVFLKCQYSRKHMRGITKATTIFSEPFISTLTVSNDNASQYCFLSERQTSPHTSIASIRITTSILVKGITNSFWRITGVSIRNKEVSGTTDLHFNCVLHASVSVSATKTLVKAHSVF